MTTIFLYMTRKMFAVIIFRSDQTPHQNAHLFRLKYHKANHVHSNLQCDLG